MDTQPPMVTGTSIQISGMSVFDDAPAPSQDVQIDNSSNITYSNSNTNKQIKVQKTQPPVLKQAISTFAIAAAHEIEKQQEELHHHHNHNNIRARNRSRGSSLVKNNKHDNNNNNNNDTSDINSDVKSVFFEPLGLRHFATAPFEYSSDEEDYVSNGHPHFGTVTVEIDNDGAHASRLRNFARLAGVVAHGYDHDHHNHNSESTLNDIYNQDDDINDNVNVNKSHIRMQNHHSLPDFLNGMTFHDHENANFVATQKETESKIENENKTGLNTINIDKTDTLIPIQKNNHNDFKKLCGLHELPDWYEMRNCWLLHGWRINYTVKDCIYSLFELHNETLNIWTEFIPGIFFIFWILYLMNSKNYYFLWKNGSFDFQLITLTLWCAPLRCLTSGLVHIFYCVNSKWYKICWRIDFISIMIFTAIVAIDVSYLIYYCFNIFTRISLVIVWIVTTISGLYICAKTKSKLLKNAVIGAYFAVSAGFGLALQTILLFTGFYKNFPLKIMISWVSASFSLLFGSFFFNTHFPEKLINYNIVVKAKNAMIAKTFEKEKEKAKGKDLDKKQTIFQTLESNKFVVKDSKINYCGGSHQIWHIFINLMHVCIIFMTIWFQEYRITSDTC